MDEFHEGRGKSRTTHPASPPASPVFKIYSRLCLFFRCSLAPIDAIVWLSAD